MEDVIQTIITRMRVFEENIKDDAARLGKLKAAWENGRDVYEYKRQTGTDVKTAAEQCGIVVTTLQRFVRFYHLYPDGYANEIDGRPLMWGHYMAVLYQRDPQARQWYLTQAALSGWSTQEIRRRVQNNFYESSLGSAPEPSTQKTGQLAPRDQRLYTYSARVIRVVDADTLHVEVDTGFSMRYETKLRLRGINAPEKDTRLGQKALEFVQGEIFAQTQDAGDITEECQAADTFERPLIVIRSYKSDKYGRFLADVWYLKGETDAETILEKGHFLNQILLDKGLAQKMG